MKTLQITLLLLINSQIWLQAQSDYKDYDYNKRFSPPSTESFNPELRYYVSQTSGNDQNSGKAPNLAFKSLEAARRAIHYFKKEQGLPKGGVEVVVDKGRYVLPKTLHLRSADTGSKDSPIVWSGVDKTQTILSGGESLDTTLLQVVPKEQTPERFSKASLGHLYSMPLTQKQLDLLLPEQKGYGHLALDGHMLNIARWPNRGYNHIADILDAGERTRWLKPGQKPKAYSLEKPTGGKFTFREKLTAQIEKEFQETKNMSVEGYLHNDWFFQRESVGRIQDGVLQLLHHTRYGIEDKIKSLPRRVRLVNVLAELDEPGEWYADAKKQRLYLWPIPDFDPKASSLVIPGGETLVRITDASHVTIRNFTLENSGGLAASVIRGEQNTIDNCVFRNGQGKGAEVIGGKKNGIRNCDFSGLLSAFTVMGGDIRSLSRSYNYATNNLVEDCRLRGYGVVRLGGCGIYFAHNLLRNMNGALSYDTVDCLIEYNEFYNMGYEMGDFNVAYCGARWHHQANVLRFNFVHHLMEPGGHPVGPFRNDDGGAGMALFGNVFYRAGRLAAQFHGPDNHLENTISLGMKTFWWTIKKPITKEEVKKAWSDLDRFGTKLPKGSKEDYYYKIQQALPDDGWKRGPWISEYPNVARYIDINPWAQTLCTVKNNYVNGTRRPFHIHGGDGTVEGMESMKEGTFSDLPKEGEFELPHEISLDSFVSVEALDFRFKKTFTPIKEFVKIPFEKIGLIENGTRSIAGKKEYRKSAYAQFKGDTHTSYKAELVNARYPLNSWDRKK